MQESVNVRPDKSGDDPSSLKKSTKVALAELPSDVLRDLSLYSEFNNVDINKRNPEQLFSAYLRLAWTYLLGT